MKKTNDKILIGSISQYLDKKTIMGNAANPKAVVLLNVLLSNYNYALSQLEAGNPRYNDIVQNITDKIDTLKYSCPDICVYKNQLLYPKNNTE